MSDSRQLLCDMAEGLFAELADADFAAAWARIEEAGFATLLVPEDKGGFGGDWGDAYAVLRLAGKSALAVPLAETLIGHALLAEAGIAAPAGPIGLCGSDGRVLYGRHCSAVATVTDGELRLFDAAACTWEEGTNPAGEPHDRAVFTGAPAAAPCGADPVALGAFARVAQSAGALEAAFELTLEHVNTRVQFGKPLGKFQAVQQAMAEFSVEAAAVDAAGQAMATALDNAEKLGGEALFEIAVAKLRANIAIEKGFPIAHRLHAAIGFTMEYALNRFTRRLMGWRSEFGNDAYWSERLGRRVAGLGGAALWPEITRRGDALIPA